MTTPIHARIGEFYTRAGAAQRLTEALGPYNWHKDLMCTTERTKDYQGYKGAGILLVPACTFGQQPHYEVAEVDAYITAMQAAFPYLKARKLKPKMLALPCIDKRLTRGKHGFRLNHAKKV